MSGAVGLAALAGALAVPALVEWAELLAHARRRAVRPGGGRLRRSAVALLLRLGRGAGGAPASGSARTPGLLAAAGHPLGLEAADVRALRAGAAALAVAGAAVLAPLLPGRLWVAVLLGAPAAGFLAPDLALRRRAWRRAAAMADELPDLLDLLRVSVQAGRAPLAAVEQVARHRDGVLARELGRCAAAVALGEPRALALARLREHAPLDGVAALAAALERAELHGAPLAGALQALAADARADRARRVHERAARAAPKIQLVVALLSVPAAMLLIAAAVLQAMR